MHNQNDVGNFIVHVNGESVIPDVGRGRYTKAYFGPERYQHFVNSSRGHSVPIVNGCEQLAGSSMPQNCSSTGPTTSSTCCPSR